MIKIIEFIIILLGKIFSVFYSSKILFWLIKFKKIFFTEIQKKHFKQFGKKSILGSNLTLINTKYITIGNNTSIGNRTSLGCFLSSDISPQLIIGNNVSIGEDTHITSANKINIGNNVLTGKKVLISDNAHGDSRKDNCEISPMQRKLFSKGPINIQDNVWIGEKATILSNVTIGYGSIIGANAVVTKDVPPYSIVVGNPGKIIKMKEI